jgi:hypothetical protein
MELDMDAKGGSAGVGQRLKRAGQSQDRPAADCFGLRRAKFVSLLILDQV